MPANRNGFALDYIDVATRIVEFRTQHPEGSLQQVSLDFREVAGSWWVIYTAAAYRTPNDERPGIGTAWEPIPGKTNFTRDSEVQNAETAAWGRAIVAALAGDTKKGIASAEEVRNRQAPQAAPEPEPPFDEDAHNGFMTAIEEATSVEVLNRAGQQIAAAKMPADARQQLRDAFSKKLGALRAAA